MRCDYRQMTTLFHPILIEVLEDIEQEFGEKEFTSLYRKGDAGVHGTILLRGTDVKERNEIVGYVIKGWVNSRWRYDPERPEKKVCVYHDTGSGLHLHVQVHPNTQRRQ